MRTANCNETMLHDDYYNCTETRFETELGKVATLPTEIFARCTSFAPDLKTCISYRVFTEFAVINRVIIIGLQFYTYGSTKVNT